MLINTVGIIFLNVDQHSGKFFFQCSVLIATGKLHFVTMCCMLHDTKKACYPSIERSFKNVYNGTMCCMLHGTMYEKSMLPLNRKVFQKCIQWYHLLHKLVGN